MNNHQGWQNNLDQKFLQRLLRPLVQPGVINTQMAKAIIARTQRFANRLPLLYQIAQRHQNVASSQVEQLPIVYAQPLPGGKVAKEIPNTQYPIGNTESNLQEYPGSKPNFIQAQFVDSSVANFSSLNTNIQSIHSQPQTFINQSFFTSLKKNSQLNVSWAVQTAATQTKPAYAGFRNLDFPLAKVGGLGFDSRESVAGGASVLFPSPGLKLTPMHKASPLQPINDKIVVQAKLANPNKQVGVEKPYKFVGAGLVITPDQNQFLMFKTRPPHVGFISTHLLTLNFPGSNTNIQSGVSQLPTAINPNLSTSSPAENVVPTPLTWRDGGEQKIAPLQPINDNIVVQAKLTNPNTLNLADSNTNIQSEVPPVSPQAGSLGLHKQSPPARALEKGREQPELGEGNIVVQAKSNHPNPLNFPGSNTNIQSGTPQLPTDIDSHLLASSSVNSVPNQEDLPTKKLPIINPKIRQFDAIAEPKLPLVTKFYPTNPQVPDQSSSGDMEREPINKPSLPRLTVQGTKANWTELNTPLVFSMPNAIAPKGQREAIAGMGASGGNGFDRGYNGYVAGAEEPRGRREIPNYQSPITNPQSPIPNPQVNIDALADQVERKLMRRLVVESERRGRTKWS